MGKKASNPRPPINAKKPLLPPPPPPRRDKEAELKCRVEKVKAVCEIQSRKGNYDTDEYMRGLANGLIIAVATLEDKEPRFKKGG